MATGYQGYQGATGYGDPARKKVDRARQLAELLQQGVTDTGPKSFWEGAAQLGKAFIARDAMGKAEKAETSYAKNQERLLNHFLDPNTTADGYAMQPTINVGTDQNRKLPSQRQYHPCLKVTWSRLSHALSAEFTRATAEQPT